MTTSSESRKYIYGIISGSSNNNLTAFEISKHLIKIEEKYNNALNATKIYSKGQLELLLEAISLCNNKEERSNLLKIMMSLVIVGSKDSILSKHNITAIKNGFQVESSRGLFGKSSHHLTPAMLEYVISNGEIKKDSSKNIPSDVVDSLIESTLEFNSSKNSHSKFLTACAKTSIQSREDMEAELEDVYKIKNNIPDYIIDLAYKISFGNIIIIRNEGFTVSYKNKEKNMVSARLDLWDYTSFLNSLLRGDSIISVIDSFTRYTVKKI